MTSAAWTTGPAGGVLDAVVIGAGVAGLYQLHQLREEGLRVRAYDAADDVGGTWWWHGFPGARVDTEGHTYQLLFSETLDAEVGVERALFPPGTRSTGGCASSPTASTCAATSRSPPGSSMPATTRTGDAGPSAPTAAT